MPYLRKVSQLKKEDDGPCPICMSELSEMSGFTEGSTDDDSGLYKLTKCGHIMHTPCVAAYVENSNFSKVKYFTIFVLGFSIFIGKFSMSDMQENIWCQNW